MNNNHNSHTITYRMSELLQDIIIAVLRTVIKTLLWVAKHVWKRYFGIETPVYKLWWKAHSERMQEKLDIAHSKNMVQSF